MVAVALVYPPYHFKAPIAYLPFSRPTLVLAHLYAVLESAGIEPIEVIDLDLDFDHSREQVDYFLSAAVKRVEDVKPDVVCLSCKAAQFPFSTLFSKRYKLLHPDVKIILGGIMPTLAPETVLKLSGCDAVIRGEGEKSLPELIKRIDDERWSIEGVSYVLYDEEAKVVHNPNAKVLSQEELDSLPLPRYDVLPDLQRYKPGSMSQFSVEATRGCPNHQCVFCWNSTKNCETNWRAKAPRRVVKEIKFLTDTYGAQVIYFTDDDFGANPTWLNEFTSLMENTFKPDEVRYVASTRVDSFDPRMLKRLYRSGLRTAFHGIESGSPRCWKMLGKNLDPMITREYILNLIRTEVEVGIVPSCSFIVAFPNETEEDLDETIGLCKELANLGALFSIQILAPNEGTALFEEYQHIMLPFDVYNEFGESENFSPEFRKVFDEQLNDFFDYLPDNRWFKPSMPLDRFKKKFTLLLQIAEDSYIRRFTTMQTQTYLTPSHMHMDEGEGGVIRQIGNVFKRLLRSS